MRGPVPKRSDQRRRRNKPEVEITTAPGAAVVEVPPADPDWHPIAVRWYASLAQSGQSRFYEPSDWAVALYVAEGMSRSLLASRLSANLFAAVVSASSNLLVTEGDRRRLRIELERAAGDGAEAVDEAKVTALDAYRRAAGG